MNRFIHSLNIRLFTTIFMFTFLMLVAGIAIGCILFSPIVGKWQDNQSYQYEFTRDGKVIIISSRLNLKKDGFRGDMNYE